MNIKIEDKNGIEKPQFVQKFGIRILYLVSMCVCLKKESFPYFHAELTINRMQTKKVAKFILLDIMPKMLASP